MSRAPLIRLYNAGVMLALPFAARARVNRLRRAGVPVHRAHEVLGNTSAQRPGGQLLWIHAASVGESLSVLPLIDVLQSNLPGLKVVLSTHTPTSAALLEARLPAGAVHQFAPLDAPGPVNRFLRRWRPDAALFIESEIWPNMLHMTPCPKALIGARLSERSLARWARIPRTARDLFGQFSLIITQDPAQNAPLSALSGVPVETGINLKSMSGPLPQDPDLMERALEALEGRMAWIAASTHPGEEEIILAAHQKLLTRYPRLALILVPRHPERGDEIARLIASYDLSLTRRSARGWPTTHVWLADTMGELGSLYPLASIAFVGGSLAQLGGHNPYEAAHAGCAILTGPHVENFAQAYADMGPAALRTPADRLGDDLAHLIATPPDLKAARARARAFSHSTDGQSAALAAKVQDILGL